MTDTNDPSMDDAARQALAAFAPNLADWPRSWRYDDEDIAPGEQIVAYLTPFLLHLLGTGLTLKTLRRHRNNVWLLGGELIRNMCRDPDLRTQAIESVIRNAVDSEGGPLLSGHETEEEQRSFDSTCRKLAKYLDDQSASSKSTNHTPAKTSKGRRK